MKRRREITEELLKCYREFGEATVQANKDKLGGQIKTLEWVLESGKKKN